MGFLTSQRIAAWQIAHFWSKFLTIFSKHRRQIDSARKRTQRKYIYNTTNFGPCWPI